MTLDSGHCRPSTAEIAELVDLSTDEVSHLLSDATSGSETDSNILRRLSELEDRLTVGEGWRGLWGILLANARQGSQTCEQAPVHVRSLQCWVPALIHRQPL